MIATVEKRKWRISGRHRMFKVVGRHRREPVVLLSERLMKLDSTVVVRAV